MQNQHFCNSLKFAGVSGFAVEPAVRGAFSGGQLGVNHSVVKARHSELRGNPIFNAGLLYSVGPS